MGRATVPPSGTASTRATEATRRHAVSGRYRARSSRPSCPSQGAVRALKSALRHSSDDATSAATDAQRGAQKAKGHLDNMELNG